MARRVPRLPLCAVIGWGCPKRLAVLLRGAALLAGSRGSSAGRSAFARARVARRAWPLRSMALQGTLPYI
jgi:hypothetical protein